MKKFLYMAVAAIAVLSSCDKNDALLDDNGNGVSNADAPVFTATIESDATKTTLVEGSTAGKLTKVAWLNSDKVFIAGSTTGFPLNMTVIGDYSVTPGVDASTATLTPGTLLHNNSTLTTGITYAVYPASISAYHHNNITSEMIASASYVNLKAAVLNIYLPATQIYNGTDISQIAPMFCWSKTTSLEFCNLNALLAVTVSASDFSSVASIIVSTDKKIVGEFNVKPEYKTLTEPLTITGSDTEELHAVTLDCQNAGANTTIPSGESKTFYIAIPANTYNYLQIDVTDGTNTKYMRTKAGANISVERNKIYPLTFAKNYDPNLLAGEFSVSATKKVKFTKANLYWDGSAYQFEADQTNYPNAWNTSHVGLFFWSNYTDYTRTDEHAHEYKPYYSSFAASSKSTTDEFWCSEDHPLEVAGTQSLYVLSSDEWNYLLNIPYNNNPVGRTQTNRFAKARVNGKAGLLIFPDGYNTELTSITGIATVNDDWDAAYPGESESIPTDTWSAMEAAGVVFLPAAGYRGDSNGQTITPGNCYYWSSTPNSDNKEKANGLSGKGYQFTCPGTIQRHHGSSIRLVKTVE